MISARIRATVVLPAPLSPTNAVTLRASRLTETLSTACTGALRANGPRPCLTQKYLVRLRPSSTGAVELTAGSPAAPSAPGRPPPARGARAQAAGLRRRGAASTRPRDSAQEWPRGPAPPACSGRGPTGSVDGKRTPRGDPAGREVTLGSPPSGRACHAWAGSSAAAHACTEAGASGTTHWPAPAPSAGRRT